MLNPEVVTACVFAIFTWKQLCQSSFFNKVAGLRPYLRYTLFKEQFRVTISVNSYFFSFDLAISKLFSIFIPPEYIEMKNWTEMDQNNKVNDKLLIRATWGSNIVLHGRLCVIINEENWQTVCLNLLAVRRTSCIAFITPNNCSEYFVRGHFIAQKMKFPVKRYTNADLKISQYLCVDIKTIPWKFRILNPNKESHWL